MSRAAPLIALALVAAAVALPAASGVAEQRPLCLGKPATIVGSQRSEDLDGTMRNDVIVGLGGSDSILALGGDDLICGGPGNDQLYADGIFYGPKGNADAIDGGPGSDVCREAERVVRCEETRPDIFFQGPLSSGAYVVETFSPEVAFVLGSGWTAPFSPLPSHIVLSQRANPRGLTLVFDSTSARQSVAATIARLAKTKGVRADRPRAVRIGGYAGQRVDLRVTAGDRVFVRGLFDPYELDPRDRVRAYAIRVRGDTVTVLVEAPAGQFPGFVAVAERVLTSVRFS